MVINSLYTNGSFSCNSLVLNADISLLDGEFVSCVNGVSGTAKIIMSSEASFVQLNSISDAPKIELTKATRDVMRLHDYIYWGTPIEGDFIGQIASAQASTALIPNAFDNKFQYQSGPGGGWQVLEATTTGRGFITRVRNQAPFVNNTANDYINMDFIGFANNGNIVVPIDQDPAVPNGGRSHNLLANPYPSSIDGNRFVEENTSIDGAIYLWTAANPIGNNGNYSQADYLVFTRMGVTYPTDFSATFDGKIASGQGFLVKALAEDETVTFTNCMRLNADNNSFFKTNATDDNNETLDRFKLNLTGENGVFNQILIGYSSESTLGYDRMYDATSNSASTAQIFSVLDNSNLRLSINARPEFHITDVVPVGIRKNNINEETFTISLAEQEGVFNTETILVFLHDKLMNSYHNLSQSPFVITTSESTIMNRFEILYYDLLLDNPTTEIQNTLSVLLQNQVLNISAHEGIEAVFVFDMTGKKLFTQKSNQDQEVRIPFIYPQGIYIIKITLSDGTSHSKKIIQNK